MKVVDSPIWSHRLLRPTGMLKMCACVCPWVWVCMSVGGVQVRGCPFVHGSGFVHGCVCVCVGVCLWGSVCPWGCTYMCMWRLEANRVSNSVTSTLFSDTKLVCLQKFKASLDQASLSQKQNRQAKLKKNILNLKIQAKGTETTPNDGLGCH